MQLRTRGGFLNLKSKLHLSFTNVPHADYDNMYDLFTIVVHKSSANYFEIKTIAYYGQAEPNPYSARTRGFPRRLALEEKASSYTPFNLT